MENIKLPSFDDEYQDPKYSDGEIYTDDDTGELMLCIYADGGYDAGNIPLVKFLSFLVSKPELKQLLIKTLEGVAP
jgi:hypothetical protein